MNDALSRDKTRSLCPSCLKWVDSYLVDKKDEGIFLWRNCIEHGISEMLLSRHNKYFITLRDFYFKTHRKIFPQTRYLLFLTSQCNLHCPICFLAPHSIKGQELNVQNCTKDFKINNKELILFGAEPTCREDLCDIIKYLRNQQNSITLYTNGIKLSEKDYLIKLIESRVDKIYFQFDGFNDKIYEIIRGKPLLENKLQVLNNLKNLNSSVVLDVTIAKGINEEEIGKIFDYSLNKFIKAINFIAYVRSGCGRSYLNENSLMPDEIIDNIVKHTENKISRESILIFQKLLYTYMSLLKRRTCFYIQYFWIYRKDNKKYLTLEEIFNLKILERILDKYLLIREKSGSLMALAFLISNIFQFTLAIRDFKIFLEGVIMTISHAFKKDEYAKKDSKFLQLIFSTACDSYKADLKIVERCHIGIIYKDNSGKTCINDENGFYLLGKEVKNCT